jgi:hypothetical protein
MSAVAPAASRHTGTGRRQRSDHGGMGVLLSFGWDLFTGSARCNLGIGGGCDDAGEGMGQGSDPSRRQKDARGLCAELCRVPWR